MAKDKKKKKNTTYTLSQFLEESGVDTSVEYKTIESVENGVVKTKLIEIKTAISAPQAEYEVVIDQSVLDKGPPYRVYLTNLPYEATEEEVRAHFADANITSMELTTRDTFHSVSSFLEVQTVKELKYLLESSGNLLKRRAVGVSQRCPISDKFQYTENGQRKNRNFNNDSGQSYDFQSARGAGYNQQNNFSGFGQRKDSFNDSEMESGSGVYDFKNARGVSLSSREGFGPRSETLPNTTKRNFQNKPTDNNFNRNFNREDFSYQKPSWDRTTLEKEINFPDTQSNQRSKFSFRDPVAENFQKRDQPTRSIDANSPGFRRQNNNFEQRGDRGFSRPPQRFQDKQDNPERAQVSDFVWTRG